jgi:hypothetical protein
MTTKARLSDREYQRMLKMLADLTPAERASLKNPDFITEDEADIIVSDRRMTEPTVSLDEVLADIGLPRSRRRA